MQTVDSNLLNVKQAATILNVSEMSIRRWTDAGKLPCMRVGGRRERRFHHHDLINFLEIQSISDPGLNQARGVNNNTNVLLEGVAINYGNHLCSLYETDVGRVKLAVPFIADGLRVGDKCFLVAGNAAKDDILDHLMETYPATQLAIDGSRLIVSDGMANKDGFFAYLEQQFLQATRRGDQHLRVVGDMAWAIDKGMCIDDLMALETQIDHVLISRFSMVSLCQYDARRFASSAILGALKHHEDTFQFPFSRFIGY